MASTPPPLSHEEIVAARVDTDTMLDLLRQSADSARLCIAHARTTIFTSRQLLARVEQETGERRILKKRDGYR